MGRGDGGKRTGIYVRDVGGNIVVGRWVIEFDMLLCCQIPVKCAVVLFWVLSSLLTWCVCNC